MVSRSVVCGLGRPGAACYYDRTPLLRQEDGPDRSGLFSDSTQARGSIGPGVTWVPVSKMTLRCRVQRGPSDSHRAPALLKRDGCIGAGLVRENISTPETCVV